jgi:hypothetical protein
MHQEVRDAILAGSDKLAFKTEEVPAEGERAAYLRFVVITPKIENVF